MSDCKLIEVDITPESPVTLGSRSGPNGASQVYKYIPGRSLRGALAESLLKCEQHDTRICNDSCDFCQLFLSDDRAIFRNAYPAAATGRSRPMPFTAMRCKVNPDHGAFDLLIPHLISNLAGFPLFPRCHACGDTVERAGGFSTTDTDDLKAISPPPTRELVRVGIDRARQTAAQQILYRLIAIAEPADRTISAFRGEVICPSNLADDVARLLSSRVRRLGGASTRGMGNVRVGARVVETPANDLPARLKKFNDSLLSLLEHRSDPLLHTLASDLLQRPGTLPAFKSGRAGFFSVDLLSDTFIPSVESPAGDLVARFSNDFVLTPEALRYVTTCPNDATLVASFASWRHVTGWNAAWNLPRPVELASEAGGVFVYWTDDLQSWLPVLVALEQRGFGSRLAEGFGQIEICSPCHLAAREEKS